VEQIRAGLVAPREAAHARTDPTPADPPAVSTAVRASPLRRTAPRSLRGRQRAGAGAIAALALVGLLVAGYFQSRPATSLPGEGGTGIAAAPNHTAPPAARAGRAAIAAFWAALADAFPPGTTPVLQVMEVEHFGHTANVIATWEARAPDGSLLDGGHILKVFKRDRGEWLIHRSIFNSK
jgi:hypothetical protein